eukprot:CAMPEP_0168569654 /NCGR_PEP_ID=MMETSP0413-20121227/16289_1 /TAXON_ID=136452 /ORGANISM="Filamoeba nolandi, Strain NC-AS-23-1" /LENGTH=760 /DNA_ID=CAMNT_0008602197 /DNA_START=65 /DNA_END=2347 /DNA_ORIENTATION=-
MDKSLAQEVVGSSERSSRPGSSNEKVESKEPVHPATVPTARKTEKDKVDVENQKELLQKHFTELFELPDERLLEDYACALQDKLALIHGRMYISDHYVCFASTIFKQTMKKISFKEITGLYKKNTAIVFPNAIEIHTKDQRLFFMSFIFRDQAFHSLWIRWENAKKEITQQIRSARSSVVSRKKIDTDSEESNDDSEDSEDSDSDDNNQQDSDDSEEEVEHHDDAADSDAESEENEDDTSSKHSAHAAAFVGTSLDSATSAATSGLGLQAALTNAAARQSLAAIDTSKLKPADSEPGYRMVKRRSNSWSNDLIRKSMDESSQPAADNNNNESHNKTEPESNEQFTTLPIIDIPCKHLGLDEAGSDYYINELYPVSVAQFFHTLLADKSEFWISVNLVHDYTENVCSPWALDEAKCCYVRNISFVSPVNAVIGPKQTRVQATQRIRFDSPDHLVLDHSSVSKDVPYGDTFYIVTRYEVTKKGNGCLFQVATAVKFTKTVWGMKGMIERISIDSSRNFNQKFATMAKEKFPAPAAAVIEKPKPTKQRVAKPTKTKKRKQVVAQPEAPKPVTQQSLVSAITELTSSPLVSDIVRAIYLLLLFVLFVLVFSLYSTIAHLNDQIALSTTAASKAENKILFLQHFVETVVRNITGVDGALKEQWVLWQSHKELLNKLDGYKIQMDLLKSEIEKTQHMLGDLELEGLNADKVFEDATPTSIFSFFFKMLVLGAISYAVYWAILNKDMILQTMSTPKKTNPPTHSKTD